jgi:predicted nuclease with RNAse H fold
MILAGIDLTASARRPTACAKMDDSFQLQDIRTLATDDEILRWLDHCHLVGLDAPCTLPRGLNLCCMDDPPRCSCTPQNPFAGRQAEKKLLREGIRAYIITRNSFAKQWIRRGLLLREKMEQNGIEVVEVYPTGTKKRLFGHLTGPKTSRYARQQLQMSLRTWVGSLPHPGDRLLSHDELDAVLACLTAVLYVQGFTEGIGDPDEGLIHLPRKGLSPHRISRKK